MFQPTPVTVRSTNGPSASGTQNPNAVLKKDDFLLLLTTQLRNQDPLNPLDQNQFLSQTAQFTSLEQLQNMSKQLEELKAVAGGGSMAQAATLIGKTAAVSGRGFRFDGATDPSLSFLLEASAPQVSVEIFDREGKAVRTLTREGLEAGENTIRWDGRDAEGRRVTGGDYFYRVSTPGQETGAAPAVVAAVGRLTGFERQGSTLLFRMGDVLIRQEDILELE